MIAQTSAGPIEPAAQHDWNIGIKFIRPFAPRRCVWSTRSHPPLDGPLRHAKLLRNGNSAQTLVSECTDLGVAILPSCLARLACQLGRSRLGQTPVISLPR